MKRWPILLVCTLLVFAYFVYTYKEMYADAGSLNYQHNPDKESFDGSKLGSDISTDEPAPSNLPLVHTGELCSQCIGNCHLRLWAGVYKATSGQSEKQFCVQKCNDVCVNFD